MNTIDPYVRETENAIARQQSHYEAVDQAERSLRAEMIDALLQDPTRKVSCPGFDNGALPASGVVLDMFYNVPDPEYRTTLDGNELLVDLLKIASQAARLDELTPQQRLALEFLAASTIGRVADEHARFHKDDAL